ncbi:MetQ/NlpA family ABC transporter substrate-binding protein, partial [Streptococcus pneumoniae]
SNPAVNNTANDPLTVIASASPHAEILEWIDEQDDSFTLDVAIATDGAGSNVAVENGSADANFFQHLPYLRDWEAQTGKTLA